MAKKQKRWQLGDIVCIPILAGQFAFARMMKEGDYEIYTLLSKSKSPPLDEIIDSGVAFYKCGTDKPVNDGTFGICYNVPFLSDEIASMPPQATCYDRDSGTWTMSTPQIMVHGDSRPAAEEEVSGLDIWSFSADAEAIVFVIEDRLVNGNNDDYKVR